MFQLMFFIISCIAYCRIICECTRKSPPRRQRYAIQRSLWSYWGQIEGEVPHWMLPDGRKQQMKKRKTTSYRGIAEESRRATEENAEVSVDHERCRQVPEGSE
jgi:hypothetical protein